MRLWLFKLYPTGADQPNGLGTSVPKPQLQILYTSVGLPQENFPVNRAPCQFGKSRHIFAPKYLELGLIDGSGNFAVD